MDAIEIIEKEIKRLRGLYKTSAYVKPSIVIKILRDVQNKIRD
jgi:hypothetical protein